MITEDYRKLNAELHARGVGYGTSGKKWASTVQELARALPALTILDYGCGTRSLEAALGFGISNYDPALSGLDAPPEPADLVVCTDVLEHIEPDCLTAVLDDLRRCTLKAGLFSVATRPAKKFLADGRNAHLIVEGQRFWLPKLMERWEIFQLQMVPGEMVVVVKC